MISNQSEKKEDPEALTSNVYLYEEKNYIRLAQ